MSSGQYGARSVPFRFGNHVRPSGIWTASKFGQAETGFPEGSRHRGTIFSVRRQTFAWHGRLAGLFSMQRIEVIKHIQSKSAKMQDALPPYTLRKDS
jgi:hypothetical protein